jgi:hypothetical protein
MHDHVRIRGRRYSMAIRNSKGQHDLPSNSIAGVIKLEYLEAYTPDLILNDFQRMQYLFWKGLSTLYSSCSLFIFNVVGFSSLPVLVPVQQCSTKKAHGFCVELEAGQPGRIAGTLAHRYGHPISAHNPPLYCLRLPIHIVKLFLDTLSQSPSLVVPSFDPYARGDDDSIDDVEPEEDKVQRRVGKQTFRVDWKLLGLDPRIIPSAPALRSCQGEGQMNSNMAQTIANLLRVCIPKFDVRDDTDAEFVILIREHALVLQTLSDALDITSIQTMVSEFQPSLAIRGDAGITVKRLYKATFVVHVLLQSHLLRESGNLVASIRNSIRMFVPAQLAKPLLDMLKLISIPSKGTISRWRLLVDVAHMRRMRIFHAEELKRGGCARWSMFDSSQQGHRNYLLFVITSAQRSDLPRMMFLAELLVSMRRTLDAIKSFGPSFFA